uniref:Uncharacterized protein n=1 Tax=Oryza meridionalis TaxID=40149 RepID=A0A0E0ECW2_9ORYZ
MAATPTTSSAVEDAAADELRRGAWSHGRRRILRGDGEGAGDELWRGAWTAEDPAWTRPPAEAWTTGAVGDELPTEDAVAGDKLRFGLWTGEDATAGDEVRVQCGAWTGEDAAAGE